MSLIHVLLVDNHPVTLSGLKSELTGPFFGSEFRVVAEALSGAEALDLLDKGVPADVIVLDIEMKEMDGLALAEAIRENDRFDAVKIIMYTNHESRLMASKAMAIGVDGYVLKESPMATLKEGIARVHSGQYYVDLNLGKASVKGAAAKDKTNPELTEYEKRIICEILKQKKDSEIALTLKISTENVENYKRKIREKTGATNVVGIVLYAIEHHLCRDF